MKTSTKITITITLLSLAITWGIHHGFRAPPVEVEPAAPLESSAPVDAVEALEEVYFQIDHKRNVIMEIDTIGNIKNGDGEIINDDDAAIADCVRALADGYREQNEQTNAAPVEVMEEVQEPDPARVPPPGYYLEKNGHGEYKVFRNSGLEIGMHGTRLTIEDALDRAWGQYNYEHPYSDDEFIRVDDYGSMPTSPTNHLETVPMGDNDGLISI